MNQEIENAIKIQNAVPQGLSSAIMTSDLKESEKLNLQILGYELENHGYKFNLKGEGLLVMNNVYRTNWSFTCNNSEKKIYPVNEIMMGVFITKGCTEGRLTYDLDY